MFQCDVKRTKKILSTPVQAFISISCHVFFSKLWPLTALAQEYLIFDRLGRVFTVHWQVGVRFINMIILTIPSACLLCFRRQTAATVNQNFRLHVGERWG